MGKSQGFTLIELMVTMVVLAIVASIAMPNFQKVRAKQKIEYSTKDLEKTLIQARYDAVLHRHRVTVNLGEAGNSTPQTLYWSVPGDQQISYLQFSCESNAWDGEAIEGIDRLVFLTDGSAQLSRNFTDDDGQNQREDLTLSAIQIVVSNGVTTNYVEITPLGKVTAKSGSKQGQECS